MGVQFRPREHGVPAGLLLLVVLFALAYIFSQDLIDSHPHTVESRTAARHRHDGVANAMPHRETLQVKQSEYIDEGDTAEDVDTDPGLYEDPVQQQGDPAGVECNKRNNPDELGISWPPVLSFIQSGSPICQDLFVKDFHGRNKTYNDKFQKELDKLHKFIRDDLGNTRIEGNSIFHIEEGLAYWELVSRTSAQVRTICETGFNAGHSTLLWLLANPFANVFSFDLGEHDYSPKVADYLNKRFDNRLHMTWGDSRTSMPKFREENPDLKCDVIIIDGGHTVQIANSDWYHFCHMSKINSLVILDNYPDKRWGYDYGDFGKVWELAKQQGDISELFRCAYTPDVHGFTFGRVIGNQCEHYQGNFSIPVEPPRTPVLNVRLPNQ